MSSAGLLVDLFAVFDLAESENNFRGSNKELGGNASEVSEPEEDKLLSRDIDADGETVKDLVELVPYDRSSLFKMLSESISALRIVPETTGSIVETTSNYLWTDKLANL